MTPSIVALTLGMTVMTCRYLCVTQCDAAVPTDQGVFYIAGLFSTSVGRGVLPAVRLAVQHVNTHLFLLKGFELQMYWDDTKVGDNVSLRRTYQRGHL